MAAEGGETQNRTSSGRLRAADAHLSLGNFDSFPRDPDPVDSDPYRFYRVLRSIERWAPHAFDGQMKWLDIGCHSGSFLRAVTTVLNCEGYGCDVYPEAHKEDRIYECFQLTENSHWQYRQMDVSHGVDWDGRKFNAVSALEVIEHLIDTDRFLQDVRGALVDGGLFVITTPNINSLRNRLGVPFGQYPIGIEYRNQIHHVRLYNVKVLKDHLKAHGFDVLGVAGVQMLPRALLLQRRFLQMASDTLGDLFPQLASNVIVVARKAA